MAPQIPQPRRAGAAAHRWRRAAATLVAASSATLLLGSCRASTTPSAAAFCRRIAANRAALQGPAGDSAAIGRTLAAYRTVAQVAPAAVREAWDTVTALVESAASADLTQSQSAERLAARALAAKPEIEAIVGYTRTTCDLDIASGLAPATPPVSDPAASDPAASDPAGATTEAPGTIPPTAAP